MTPREMKREREREVGAREEKLWREEKWELLNNGGVVLHRGEREGCNSESDYKAGAGGGKRTTGAKGKEARER